MEYVACFIFINSVRNICTHVSWKTVKLVRIVLPGRSLLPELAGSINLNVSIFTVLALAVFFVCANLFERGFSRARVRATDVARMV